jgi:G protein beta subunit-like protein
MRSVTVASDGSMLIAVNNKVRRRKERRKKKKKENGRWITNVVYFQKGNCYVWKLPNGTDTTEVEPIHQFQAHSNYILRVMLSPDSK